MHEISDLQSSSINKVSVVMPVYNAAAYMAEAIESLRKQTYYNWELIIVNDGSGDGSDQIARAMQSDDARIRIVDQENQGPSAARNRGMREAMGDYLYFLDADDLLDPDALAVCVEAFDRGGIDAVSFDSQSFVDEKSPSGTPPPSYDRSRALVDGVDYDIDEFASRCYAGGVLRANICLYMFPAALLGDLLFPVGSHYAEESIFCYLACLKARKIRYVASKLHRRRWRSDSLVGTVKGQGMIDGYSTNLSILKGVCPPLGAVQAHAVFLATTVNYLLQSYLRVELESPESARPIISAAILPAALLTVCSRMHHTTERLRQRLRML